MNEEKISLVSSPLGTIELRETNGFLTDLNFRSGPPSGAPSSAVLRAAARELEEYFAGKRVSFDLPLDPAGTPFQGAVWRALREVPFGETATYGEIARRVGHPAAARAVGAANGRNPISIIIPCHRIIGADGSLTGYGGGLDRKEWLLRHERAHARPGGRVFT